MQVSCENGVLFQVLLLLMLMLLQYSEWHAHMYAPPALLDGDRMKQGRRPHEVDKMGSTATDDALSEYRECWNTDAISRNYCMRMYAYA